jgi:hypothetical protein
MTKRRLLASAAVLALLVLGFAERSDAWLLPGGAAQLTVLTSDDGTKLLTNDDGSKVLTAQ